MYKPQSILLRRTAAALAAATGMLAITDAQAQSAVRLNSGTNSAECSYATMSVAPNGTVQVSCSGSISTNAGTTTPPPTNTPPAATSFSLSSAGGTATAGSSPTLTVVRNGDTAGAYIVGYNVDGDACVTKGNFSVSFADGNNTAKAVTQVTMAATGQRCTVSLGQSRLPNGTYNSVNASPASATYNLGTTNSNNPPPTNTAPGGCPATPQNMQTEVWKPDYGTHNYWQFPQNVVVSVPMPTVESNPTPAFKWAPSPITNSPAEGYVRYSVTKCPGQIIENDPANWCNGYYAITTWSQKYVAHPTSAFPTKEMANLQAVCWAPINEGPWYLNFRYESFKSDGGPGCPFGLTFCGVLWQRN